MIPPPDPRKRCGRCPPCRSHACGTCVHCLGKTRFGGDGKDRNVCLKRRCIELYNDNVNVKEPNRRFVASRDRKGTVVSVTGEKGAAAAGANTTTAAHVKRPRSRASSTLHPRGGDSKRARANERPRSSSSHDEPFRMDASLPHWQLDRFPPHLAVETSRSAGTDASYNLLDASLVADDNDNKKQKSPTDDEQHQQLYGQSIPPKPMDNCCAACGIPDDPTLPIVPMDKVILLCDGPDCGREYHMSCCLPPLSQVPEGEWLCHDCSKEGASEALMDYLHANDVRRQEQANGDSVVYQKLLEEQDVEREKSKHGMPVSELKRARDILHHIKESTLPTPRRKSLPDGVSTSLPSTLAPLEPEDFLGKPIRLYDPSLNQYHAGRLVDYRPYKPAQSPMKEESKAPQNDDTDQPEQQQVVYEYLARFCAGRDNRKTDVLHWIVLEEHALAVAISLVWIRAKAAMEIKGAEWLPAQLMLRTSRELVTDLERFPNTIVFAETPTTAVALPPPPTVSASEAANPPPTPKTTRGTTSTKTTALVPIKFRTPTTTTTTMSPPTSSDPANSSTPTTTTPSKRSKTRTIWAWARIFGSDVYHLQHVQKEVAKWSDDRKTGPQAGQRTEALDLTLLLARQEVAVQEQVKKWKELPLLHPMGPHAWKARDLHTLGPVVPKLSRAGARAFEKPSPLHTKLAPNVHLGLDRMKLVDRLSRRGFFRTRDMAASLSVTFLPVQLARFRPTVEPSPVAAPAAAVSVSGGESVAPVVETTSEGAGAS